MKTKMDISDEIDKMCGTILASLINARKQDLLTLLDNLRTLKHNCSCPKIGTEKECMFDGVLCSYVKEKRILVFETPPFYTAKPR